MADGTGDDYGAPTLAQLKQMSWDIGYIRDKLTLDGNCKSFILRKNGGHQVILGSIVLTHWNLLGAFRSMASRIAAGEDGPAPPVSDFGQSNYTTTQLTNMYNQLATISAKVMMGKRALIMRMSGLAGSNIEFLIGDIEASHASYRSAISLLAAQIDEGKG